MKNIYSILLITILLNTCLLQGQNNDYTLIVDKSLNDSGALFTLRFINNTDQKEAFLNAEVSILIEDKFGNNYSQYLYKTDITEQEQMIDDNYIQFDGKDYVIVNEDTTVKFLPTDIVPGFYTFKVAISHNKFDTIYSNSIPLNLPLILKEDSRKNIYLRGSIDTKVYGEIELIIGNNNNVDGRFTNIDTRKIIPLSGKYILGFFGVDTLNLEEYENSEKVTGYFEGDLVDGIYKGYWISPKKTIRVSFIFTNR